MSKKLLIAAGEASGDRHGARLLGALRDRMPELSVYGLGGEQMRAEGVDLVADVSAISVIGLAEVVRVLPRARTIFRTLVERAKQDPPDLAVLIDFPEFNLRLAPVLARGGVRVVYYVSPQVWAWRKGRVNAMARSIEKMLVLFPFEVDFYRGKIPVSHVGHPLVDEVPERSQAWDAEPDEAPSRFRLVLLPGSRTSEVKRLLPVLLEAAEELQRACPGMETALVQAATVDEKEIDRLIRGSGLDVRRVAESDRFDAIASSHLALCTSGTATLEVGLLRTPMVVVYRIGFFSYWLGRAIVDVSHISLVNLVLGRSAVPELIQNRARSESIAAEALGILRNPARRRKMRVDLAALRPALGQPGASLRAASEVAALLESAP